MPFDFNANPVHLSGQFPQRPHPVTVDVYGYCQMACSYCSSVDTPIMLADLTTKPAGDIEVGDELLGWQKGGKERSKARPEAESRMETRWWDKGIVTHVVHRRAPVVRLELANGETVTCTPDHPWFTGRSDRFEYMPPSKMPWRALRRIEVELMPQRPFGRDYMIGYLRGVMEGDGCWMPQGTWRIALKDREPLARIASFLLLLGLGHFDARPFNGQTPEGWSGEGYMQELVFPVGSPVNELINGFDIDTPDYVHGWLGGIYDAEGNTPGGWNNSALRICQYRTVNPLTYQRIERFLRLCNFGCVGEDEALRLHGGREAICRFVQLARPSVERKKNPLLGGGTKGMVHTQQVVSITPIGLADVASFETTTHNYISGGFMSRNCFANRNRDAFSRELNPVNSTPALLRKLKRAIESEHNPVGFFLRERYPVCFSNTTDPFQREEKQYRSSEAFLSWAKAHRVPLYLQTRGADILLDEWDRYAPLLEPGRVVVYLSICQTDDRIRKRHEPGAPRIERRLELSRRLADHGVPVIFACNPWVREWVPEPEPYVAMAREAGASAIVWSCLHLSQAQANVVPLTYRDELVAQADLLPVFLTGVLKRWYQACADADLDFYPTEQWDAWFGHKSRAPECARPEWLGKVFPADFAILREVAQAAARADGRVFFGWEEIERGLAGAGVPNPVLDTAAFWYPFNNKVNADSASWKAALGKRAPLYEVLRYWWNHPWENDVFLWYHPRIQAVAMPGLKQLAIDDQRNLIGTFDPAAKLTGGKKEYDVSLVDWTKAKWAFGTKTLEV